MGKLLLIDGSSLLSSSFYGTVRDKGFYMAKTEKDRERFYKNLMQTSKGEYVNGVYTMCKILLKIIKNQKPTHLAVAWDITRDTFRRGLYIDYKANRSECPKALLDQFILSQRVLKEMGIYQIYSNEFEADDYLGSLSTKFEDEISVSILTKDHDSLQLATDNTTIWIITDKADDLMEKYGIDKSLFNLPDKVFPYNPMYIEEEYGVTPEQIPDYKGLVGDTSDNIPGVKGVGEKSVVPLLKEFGDIESIYDYLEDVSETEAKNFMKEIGIKRSPYKNLMQNDEKVNAKEIAFLSKRLATIVKDIPEVSSITLSELILNLNQEGMRNIFSELEFKNI